MAASLQPAPLPSLRPAQGEPPYPALPRRPDSGRLRGESEGGHGLPGSLYLGFPSLPVARPAGAAWPAHRRTWRHSPSRPASACGPWPPRPGRPGYGPSRLNVAKSAPQPGCGVLAHERIFPSRTCPKSILIQSYTSAPLNSRRLSFAMMDLERARPEGHRLNSVSCTCKNGDRFKPRKRHINGWRKLGSLCCCSWVWFFKCHFSHM